MAGQDAASTPSAAPPAASATQTPSPNSLDQQRIRTLAAILASGLALEWIRSQVLKIMATAGIAPWAASAALAFVLRHPLRTPALPPPIGPAITALGVAERQVVDQRSVYQAAYLMSAARRLEAQGADRGRAIHNELRYSQAHSAAQANREASARKVDGLAGRHGPVLSWHSVLDSRTTPECRYMAGRNFAVGDPPLGVYPGAAHPHCRCRAGPAIPGVPVTGSSGLVRVIAA